MLPDVLIQSFELQHPDIKEITVLPTPEITAYAAAMCIANLVNTNPFATITYATGDTMLPVYANLANWAQAGNVQFANTQAFHLDEYYPMQADNPYGFVKYLREHVFYPLGIQRAYELNGAASDPYWEAARYDRLLSSQKIDLAILGIGPWSEITQTGAHIGFNESGTLFSQRTHIIQLDPSTVNRDRVERGQDTPGCALTQGIANILEADQIIIIGYGTKGMSFNRMLNGHIDTDCPASALRLKGQNVSIFMDQAAASYL